MRFKLLFVCLLFAVLGVRAQSLDINILKSINSGPQAGDGTMRFISNSLDVVAVGAPTGMSTTSLINKDKGLRLKA